MASAPARMRASAAPLAPANTTTPRLNFTFDLSISTRSAASTSTTIHTESGSSFMSDQSPSPQSSPCKPCPQVGVGSQSGHSTGPECGHSKAHVTPLCEPRAIRSAGQVRRQSTLATGAAGAGDAALTFSFATFFVFRALVIVFPFVSIHSAKVPAGAAPEVGWPSAYARTLGPRRAS